MTFRDAQLVLRAVTWDEIGEGIRGLTFIKESWCCAVKGGLSPEGSKEFLEGWEKGKDTSKFEFEKCLCKLHYEDVDLR